jgi:predicted peptidase
MHLLAGVTMTAALCLPFGQTRAAEEVNDRPPHLVGASGQVPVAADESDQVRHAQIATGFLYKTIELAGERYAFCVYVPPEYSDERAWPVILFLHGSGERGSDGFLQTEVGIGRAIRRNRKLCPAIVVMPQCHAGKSWEGEMLELALSCVEDASREYHCDPKRVYLTGLSMGGAGAWLLGSRMPDAFAAMVPICGFYGAHEAPASDEELAEAASRLARLPIWCIHGAADQAVPVERSREIVAAVQAAGGEIKYNEIAEGGHNVWDGAYANPALWHWLLSQEREAPKAEEPR